MGSWCSVASCRRRSCQQPVIANPVSCRCLQLWHHSSLILHSQLCIRKQGTCNRWHLHTRHKNYTCHNQMQAPAAVAARQLDRAAPVFLELRQALHALQAVDAGQGLVPLLLSSLSTMHPSGQVRGLVAGSQLTA